MKIEKIKKTSSGKYKVVLDNNEKILTYDDVILNNGLLYKPQVDLDLLNKLNIETKYYDSYNKCVNYILKRLRSEKEINEYLDKMNTLKEDKVKIINSLKSIHLINDKNFVKAYISDKLYLTNSGPYKIKKELLEHNISEDIIDEEISKVSYSDILKKLEKLVIKKINSNKNHSSYMLKQKIISEFINNGYDKEMIISCLDNIKIESNIDSEFDKIYRKILNKYEGDELYKKIKQKLYQKGFDINEINEIINKKVEN